MALCLSSGPGVGQLPKTVLLVQEQVPLVERQKLALRARLSALPEVSVQQKAWLERLERLDVACPVLLQVRVA